MSPQIDYNFFPVYKNLEKEVVELSNYVHFSEDNLNVYSIKNVELILRIVSEIENLCIALCKKYKIAFLNSAGNSKERVYYPEYFNKLDKKLNLQSKKVTFKFDNSNNLENNFSFPFKIDEDLKIQKWYFVYNKLKHDRINFFQEATLEYIISSLACLYVLNIYYSDLKFHFKYREERDFYREERDFEKVKNMSKIYDVLILEDYSMLDDKIYRKQEWIVEEDGTSYSGDEGYYETEEEFKKRVKKIGEEYEKKINPRKSATWLLHKNKPFTKHHATLKPNLYNTDLKWKMEEMPHYPGYILTILN